MNIIERLTVGDIAIVEEHSGISISALGDEDTPKGKMLAALAFVIKRKENKDFTFADALNLTMREATDILGLEDDEEDPKEA